MDYGHELLFGTFITPAAQPPHHAVELAVLAGRAGLDLVTLQGHGWHWLGSVGTHPGRDVCARLRTARDALSARYWTGYRVAAKSVATTTD